ncbi:MAG: sugar ABC transporter ATP-binding protein [Alphaproteobacteria bacterium]
MTGAAPQKISLDGGPNDTRPLLVVRNASKAYSSTQALDDVSIDLLPGEVHALVGENGAGKTTLMNILSGVVTPDMGEIRISGEAVQFANPRQAQERGIGTVFQELSLVPSLSVAENVFTNRAPSRRGGLIRWGELHRRTRRLIALFDVDIDVKSPVGDLPVSTRQLVEIAKALSVEAQIILLDEPSSALMPDEVAALFRVVRRLKASGIGIIYVSHRMREIFEIADRITVLRDGHKIGTYVRSETTPDKIVRLMVGRELNTMFERRSAGSRDELLRTERLGVSGLFSDVNLTLHSGEIVGLAGLMGSRRGELGRTLGGALRPTVGMIMVDGVPVTMRGIADAIRLGIAYLPEDRKTDGLFLEKSVADNIIATMLRQVSRWGFVDGGKRNRIAEDYVGQLKVRTSGVSQLLGRLSGGNQQKVLVAKWLVTKPRILIVDEPTKGIDVGAKYEIHALLRRLADDGAGIIVISSDLPELLGLCDRIVVMHEGQFTGELSAEEATEESIMSRAAGLSDRAPTRA